MGIRTFFQPITEVAAQRFVALDEPAPPGDVQEIYRDGCTAQGVTVEDAAPGLHFLLTGLGLWDEPDHVAGVQEALGALGQGGLGSLLKPGGLANLVSAATSRATEPPDPALTWALRGNHLISLDDSDIGVNDSQDVDRIRAALDRIEESALRARFDPERMEALEIEPDGWADEATERLDSLIAAFHVVRGLYRDADAAMAVVEY